jgi:hypothetical protein
MTATAQLEYCWWSYYTAALYGSYPHCTAVWYDSRPHCTVALHGSRPHCAAVLTVPLFDMTAVLTVQLLYMTAVLTVQLTDMTAVLTVQLIDMTSIHCCLEDWSDRHLILHSFLLDGCFQLAQLSYDILHRLSKTAVSCWQRFCAEAAWRRTSVLHVCLKKDSPRHMWPSSSLLTEAVQTVDGTAGLSQSQSTGGLDCNLIAEVDCPRVRLHLRHL